MRANDGKEAATRERILAAAFATFAERGFARASTLEIATRARVSKRELYGLFGSKQQMLVECISRRSQRMRPHPDWPVPHDGAGVKRGLTAIGVVLLREISDPDVIAVYRLAVSEAERAPEVAQALVDYGQKAASAALRAFIERAFGQGLLAGGKVEAMAAHFLALLLQGLVLQLALGVVPRPGPAQMRRRAREAAQALLVLYPA